MDAINQNQNIKFAQILKLNKTSKNSPIYKSPTVTIPYNRKNLISNLRTINEMYCQNDNNNLIKSKYTTYNDNDNDNITENKKYDNKINNKVINININYNDKFNIFDNYQSNNIKPKKKMLDFDVLNYNIEAKRKKFNSTKNNDILDINLNNISKNIINNSLTNINAMSPLQIKNSFNSNNKDNSTKKKSLIIKKNKNKGNDKINSKKKIIVVKSHNVNNKRPKFENIKNKTTSKTEKELNESVSNILNDKDIIFLLNKNNKSEIRKKGFIKLNEFIKNKINKDIAINNINDIFMFIYYKLNCFKENDIILLIEGLSCISHMFELLINKNKIYTNHDINICYIEIIIKEFNDKINDVKIKNNFFKLLYIFIYLFSIKDAFDILLNNISITPNNLVIIKEYIIFFINVLNNNKNKDKLKKINKKFDKFYNSGFKYK